MRHKKTHPEIVETSDKLGRKFSDFLAAEPILTSGEMLHLVNGLLTDVAPEVSRDLMKDKDVSGRVMWAHVQWVRSDRPILRLSDELRDLLLRTEIPQEPLDKMPEIPFDGFYLVVDGGYTIVDNVTGDHEIEGIYVCKDKMYRSKEDREVVDGLQVLAVGEDKGGAPASGLMRNDTLTYFAIVDKVRLDLLYDSALSIQETLRVVLNLLLLWNSERSPIVTKSVTPPTPKSPGKKKRMERRGVSTAKYIRLELERGYLQKDVVRDAIEGWDGPTHIAMVRGFFRRYWVAEKPESQILGEKTSHTGKTLYLIRRFVAPHRALRRGEAPETNTYEVVK